MMVEQPQAGSGGWLARRGPYLLLATTVAVHLLFWLSMSNGLLNALFNDALHRRGQGADFFALYLAGSRALEGRSIYDPTGWQQVVPYLFPYRYTPLPAYTLGPLLAQLRPFTAYRLWTLAIEALLLFNLALTWRLARSPRQFALLASGWLAFTPFYMELFMGQFSFVMVTLFQLMGWSLLAATGAPRRSIFGAAWSFSLVWKSNSALLAPLLVRLRAWRTLLAGFLVLLLTTAPYFLRYPQDWAIFARNFQAPTYLAAHAGNFGLHAWLMAALRPLGSLAAPLPGLAPHIPRGVLLVQAGAGLIALISLLATLAPLAGRVRPSLRAPGRGRFDAVEGLALWIVVYFLVYRDVWEHHYVMLLPALTLLWLKGDFPRWPLLAAWALTAAPSLLWLFDVSGPADPEQFWPYWQSLLYHSSKALPVLALWVVLIVRTLRRAGNEANLLRPQGRR